VPEVVLAEPLAYAGPSKHGPDPELDLHHSLSVSTRYPLLTANNCAELGHDPLRTRTRCLRDIGWPEGGNQGS
jgi:hypothetical protein